MKPVSPSQPDPSRASVSVAQGAITLVVVVFASLALDDITTDNAAAFLPEYGMLAAAGAWGLFVAYTLRRTGHRFVGTMSMVAVGAAAWVAFDGLGHKRDGGWSAFGPEYTVMVMTWLWFVALSVLLLALGRRALKPAPLT